MAHGGYLGRLAAKIGVHADNLVSTVNRFNKFAADGVDEDFGRGDEAYDRAFSGGPSPLVPIETAPFHAAAFGLSDLGTKGGLRTDTHARVLDPGGGPSRAVCGGQHHGRGQRNRLPRRRQPDRSLDVVQPPRGQAHGGEAPSVYILRIVCTAPSRLDEEKPMTDQPLRVIQWTTGNIGRRSLHAIIGRDDMELVGVYAHGADKVGVDAAELAGWPEPTGVTATNDIDALIALKPDACCYNPLWPNIDELARLLEAGVNVCSSAAWITGGKQSAGGPGAHPEGLREGQFHDLRQRRTSRA